MRPVVRNLVDAFPQLTPYDLQTRRRFLAVAAGTPPRRALRLCIVCVIAACLMACVLFMALVAISAFVYDAPRGRTASNTLSWGVTIVAVVACCTPLLVVIIRDMLLDADVRRLLDASSVCRQCNYPLNGLPPPTSELITCPECGFASPVHPAFRELTSTPSPTP